MKEIMNKYQKEIGIGILSILILIVGSFTIGFWLSFFIVFIIDILYFSKDILELIDRFKNRNNKKPIKGRKSIKTSRNGKSIALAKNNKVIKSSNGKKTTSKKATSKKIDPVLERQNKRKTKRVLKKVLMGAIIGFFVLFLIVIVAGILFCYYIVDNAPEFNPNTLYGSAIFISLHLFLKKKLHPSPESQ